MNTTKIISLAMVLAMIVSAFGMIIPTADATIVNLNNDRHIMIESSTLNNYQVGNPGLFATYPIYPGSQNVAFSVRIDNDGGAGDATDDQPILYANLSATTLLRNAAGTQLTTTTNPITWDQTRVDDEESIWDWDDHTFNGFQFDVKTNAVPGVYNMTLTLDYKNDAGVADSYIGFIRFEIRQRAEVPDMGNFKPGDLNVLVNLQVNFDNYMGDWPDQDDEVRDLSISITLPDSGFWWFGESGATVTRTSSDSYDWNDWWTIPLRLSVSPTKDRGVYTGTYTLTYRTSNGNLVCTETGTMEYQVLNLPMLDVSVATTTIAQGTDKVTWALTFTNVGTVDLVDIEFQLDDNSDYFTLTPADHWEDGVMVSDSWLQLGDVAVDGIATQTMELGVKQYIPVGTHKIMFTFRGWFYDPDTTNYEHVVVDWFGIPAYPRIDGVMLNPDTSQVKGPYIDVTVTDTTMDISIKSSVNWPYTTPAISGQIFDFPLKLTVTNTGYISYTNLVLQIETNTANSPFMNVVTPAATLSEESAPIDLDDHLDWADVIVSVNVKPDTTPGVYMVPVTIKALNDDLKETVTSVVTARITVNGIGPRIEVTTVTPETIKPGAAFTLTLVLTNVGDDTARNVVLHSWFDDEDGTEETTVDGNYAEPQAGALPIYLDDIAPGASITVEIPMKSNSDMSDGHVYTMYFGLTYVDSISPDSTSLAVSIKSTGGGGSVIGTFYWTLIVLAIVIMVFLIIVAVFHVKKNRKPKAAPVQEYQPPQEQPPPPPQQ